MEPELGEVCRNVTIPVGKCSAELFDKDGQEGTAYTNLLFRPDAQRDFLKAYLRVQYYAFRIKSIVINGDKPKPLTEKDYDSIRDCVLRMRAAIAWAMNYGYTAPDWLFVPRMLSYADPAKANHAWVQVESVYQLYYMYMEKALNSIVSGFDCGFSHPFYAYDEEVDECPYVFLPPLDKNHWAESNHDLIETQYDPDNMIFHLPYDGSSAPSDDRIFYFERMFFRSRTGKNKSGSFPRSNNATKVQ